MSNIVIPSIKQSINTQIKTTQIHKEMFNGNFGGFGTLTKKMNEAVAISKEKEADNGLDKEADKLIKDDSETPIPGRTSYTDSEDAYFDSLLKKISWAYDSIFTEADADKLLEDVEFTEDDIVGMTTKGFEKSSAPNNQTSMWRELSASQTGTEKKIVHYFEEVYKKLGCCMGKDELTVNIPRYNRGTKQMETIERTIVIDRNTCTINGVDYKDDNFSESGYKPACERFMKRFIAFLLKYEPNNPMIKKYGGCLANKFLSEGVKSNPRLYSIVNNNRSCTVNECSASSYKRLGDRKNCETVFCEAITNITDNEAGRDMTFQSSIEQNCGGTAAAEYAEKIADEPKTEEDKEAEEIKKAVEEEKEIEEAEQKLEEAEEKLEKASTDEEKQEAEKEVAIAKKEVEEVIQKTKAVDEKDTTIADEEGFMFKFTSFFNNIISYFSNLFGGKTEGFANLKSSYYYIIIFAIIASIIIYIYRKYVLKMLIEMSNIFIYMPIF